CFSSSSPSWSRYLTIGGIGTERTPSSLADAARAAFFTSAVDSGFAALDDHPFGLIGAYQDSEYRVTCKAHAVVLPVPVVSAFLSRVVRHLALEVAPEMSQRSRGGVVHLFWQRLALGRSRKAVAV